MGEYRFRGYDTFSHDNAFDFSKNSSIGVGGKAEIAFCPKTVAELTDLLSKLTNDGIPYCVLGNLTNVLPSDAGTKAAVIRTKNLTGIMVTDNGVFAYAGVQSGVLLRVCKHNEKSGAEFLHGIPCTLGGALFMNAGVSGRYIAEIVESVLVYRAGRTQLLSLAECEYSYKKSVFMDGDITILAASLRLTPSTEEKIFENESYYAQKRAHLPSGRSMGCVFKNPIGCFAGDLIERSGLKGKRFGGAYISENHANFIINDGTATSLDIETLIDDIKTTVFARFGVRLEEEIRRI